MKSCYLTGMTLPGLLIGMALGAILLLFVTQLVVAGGRNLQWQSAAVQLERAGNRGLDIIASEVRAAGFRGGVERANAPAGGPGCGSDDGWVLQLTPALTFADRQDTDDATLSDGYLPGCLPLGNLQSHSDLLALRRSAHIPTDAGGAGGRRPRRTQWYLLADGRGKGEFRYVDQHLAAIALPEDDHHAWEWRMAIFFVRDYSIERGDGTPALCVERLRGRSMRSECLVEGVERLQLEFNIDTDSDGMADRWTATPTAAELEKVRELTIYLHVRSLEGLRAAGEARSFDLGGDRIELAADDPYLHRVFRRTVPLDNLWPASPRAL